MIDAGNYQLSLSIKDGSGRVVETLPEIAVMIEGGETFAQQIAKEYYFILDKEWTSGYVTIVANLTKNGTKYADGAEQVLLRNRKSQNARLARRNISVINWPAAHGALKECGVSSDGSTTKPQLYLLGKGAALEDWENVLNKVKEGSNAIIQLDSLGGIRLHRLGLISELIDVWGGVQTGHWHGNGSSYIDMFAGDQPIPSGGVISTRSWEASGDPVGFYPFRSNYRQRAYGLYFAHQYKRNPLFKDRNNTLVTYGEIEYGKGRILLNTSYWVDLDNAFADLLFFNMVEHYSAK